MRTSHGTGGVLKVVNAPPGSLVWFKLVSTDGEVISHGLRLAKDRTTALRPLYVQHDTSFQTNFTGTASFTKDDTSECATPVKMYDPSATYTFKSMYSPPWYWNGEYRKYEVSIPTGNGQSFTVDAYYPSRP